MGFGSVSVSIVTPMYKGASLVSRTIESVLSQGYSDWEMIVVDDCSPDDGAGAAIVSDYATKDSRIHLVRLENNRDSSGARNEGLRLARGKYIAFLDSDDIWHKNYLSSMMQKIKENTNPTVAVFVAGYRRMDETCTKELLAPYVWEGQKSFKDLFYYNPIFPSAAIVDRSKLKKPVFFREELRSLCDDYVFWLDILSQGLLCMGVNDVLVDYRMRSDSLTASKLSLIIPQWNIYRKVLNMNLFESLFYLASWALNGVKKYGSIKRNCVAQETTRKSIKHYTPPHTHRRGVESQKLFLHLKLFAHPPLPDRRRLNAA